MQSDVAAKLVALNREFYQSFGKEFSATRGQVQPGVRRVLDKINSNRSILDLGCGNGSVARELARRGHRGPYVGVDFSVAMLEVARKRLPGNFRFYQLDLVSANLKPDQAPNYLVPNSYELVFCFSVLHHIPNEALRLGILKQIHNLLVDHGTFIHSEWQFLNNEKLKDRIEGGMDWKNLRNPHRL